MTNFFASKPADEGDWPEHLLNQTGRSLKAHKSDDIHEWLDEVDPILEGAGVEVADSSGRDPDDYAAHPALRALWLLGQIRFYAQAGLTEDQCAEVLEAWRVLAASAVSETAA